MENNKKTLSREQAKALLLALGIEFAESERWLVSCCPVHHGDNRSAFNFDLTSGKWCCRTHHCEAEYGNDLAGLVAGVQGIPSVDAYDWVKENVDLDEMIEIDKHEEEEKIFPEFYLKRLLKSEYYKGRFTDETLAEFEHGEAESGKLRKRIVFAIRNLDGKIVGFSGRWAGEETNIDGKTRCFNGSREVPKWMHYSFRKSLHLYHFAEAKRFCAKEIIVVESIGNVMRFWEAGYKNCVACMGSSISSEQSRLLTGNSNCVILAFDNDAAGHKAEKASRKRIEHYVDVKTTFPPDQRDWAEMTTEEVKNHAQSFCQQA